MKIVILDGYAENPGDLSWDSFRKLGDLEVYDRTENALIAERIGDAEIVIVNKTPITADTIDKCSKVKYIGVLATGYNVIDINYAKEKGIVVTNVPQYGTSSVAQFAFALLLELCHHVGHHDKAVKDGRWEKNPDWCFWDYPLIELKDKTAGIIGFGRIGRATGKVAKALNMKVIAYDLFEDEAGREIAEYVSLEHLLKVSDVIFLHSPLLAETKGMINTKTIAKMKDGAIIINNSRGELIVEKDLAEALNSGKLYAAGIDVVSVEPIKADNPLLKAKNCIITPHISWASKESRQRLMDVAVDNLTEFLKGNVINRVNA